MDAAWNKGLDVFDQVYGPGSRDMVRDSTDSIFTGEIVRHVFGEVWAMPHLSVRDKRLLVIGATAMLGRPDLIAIQVAGGLANNEFTDEQLEEIAVLMLVYAGAGNASVLRAAFTSAKERAAAMKAA